MFCFVISVVASQKIEIVSIVDKSSILACLIKLYSITKSANDQSKLSFRILIMDDLDINNVTQSFGCFPKVRTDIKYWSKPPSLSFIYNIGFDTEVIYARLFLPHIFNIDKYIYLDNDIIVNADLTSLYMTPLWNDIKIITQTKKKHIRRKAIAGFVFDYNHVYKRYLKDHLNITHPLVKKAISLRGPEVFFNGGVVVVDAQIWRKLHITKKGEKLLYENTFNVTYNKHLKPVWNIWDSAIGDQGLFFVLLQDMIAELPQQYNMRRLPNKTVRFLDTKLGMY
jgi:lipopolysaccharide biosynthesis glycosyltransferase